jgi:hypothetical protein
MAENGCCSRVLFEVSAWRSVHAKSPQVWSCNVPGCRWNSTEPLMVLAWRLELALPKVTEGTAEVMASPQQSVHQRCDVYGDGLRRSACSASAWQPLSLATRAVTREAHGWGQACIRYPLPTSTERSFCPTCCCIVLECCISESLKSISSINVVDLQVATIPKLNVVQIGCCR